MYVVHLEEKVVAIKQVFFRICDQVALTLHNTI